MKLKKFLLAIALPVVALTFASCSDDDDIPAKKVPTEFTEALNQLYPNAKVDKWELKGNYHVAELKQNDNKTEIDVWFDSKAQNVMVHNEYGKNLFLVPSLINDAFNTTIYASDPWTIDDVDEYIRGNSTFYVIEVDAKGQPDTHIFFNEVGEIIKVIPGNLPDITPDYQL